MNFEILRFKRDYNAACEGYVKEFCKKQEMNFEFWVADIVGGVAVIGDYSFNMQDIIWDMNSNQPKGDILNWYDDCVSFPAEKSINYYSYTKGLRSKDIK